MFLTNSPRRIRESLKLASELLEPDGAESDEGGGKRMAMKNGDPGERRAEKQKIDQNG